MTEFLTIGEPLVVFASEEVDQSLDKVTHFKKFIAGAELNVAIGLSRLGYETEYLSQVGKDSLGNFILDSLEQAGVGKSHVQQCSNYATGFYLKERVTRGDPKVEYFRKQSAASHFELENINLKEVKIAHVTGIMAAISEQGRQSVETLLSRMHQANQLTSFDPNLRPALWRSEQEMIETINHLAKSASLVLPGIAEGKCLTGSSSEETIADFYLNQSDITQTVVVKMGSQGAYVKSKNGTQAYIKGYKVDQVKDTVGAGDGFAVGLLSGLLDELSLEQAVKRACAIGALAVQSVGDNDGYPTRPVLEAFMKERE